MIDLASTATTTSVTFDADADPRRARARALEAARVRARVRADLFGGEPPRTQIGRFELHARLGAGAAGVVYAAFDPVLERPVAVKLIVAGGEDLGLAEARALAQLAHPNLLPVFEVGVDDGLPFLVTERVDGGNLRTWATSPRSIAERYAVGLGLARGLAAAHGAGVIHRDVKPENVLVGSDGRPRLADFGLAVDEGTGRGGVGTPAYAAPELASGAAADARSDQYALGLVLAELWFGRLPTGAAQAPVRGHPLARVWPAVERCLAPVAAHRWPDVAAAVAAFERLAPAARSPLRWLAIALVGAGVAVAIAWIVWPNPAVEGDLAFDGRLVESVSSQIQHEDFAACAAGLVERVRTDLGRRTWLTCALRGGADVDFDRGCAAWRAASAATVPLECGEVLREARARQLAGDARGCVERVLAAPPTREGTLQLVRCSAAADTDEFRHRVCVYHQTAHGHPSPSTACGPPPR